MRQPLTYDDIEALEVSQRTPEAHRRAAQTLTAWAEKQHPADEVTPTDLLSAAAWHLDQAGDVEPAIEMYRRAVAAPGTTSPDAPCLLVAALLAAGRTDEARQEADTFRRSRPPLDDLAAMAETYEMVGDFREAYRWVSMGATRLDLDAIDDGWEVRELLRARRRIRTELGFPADDLDDLVTMDELDR